MTPLQAGDSGVSGSYNPTARLLAGPVSQAPKTNSNNPWNKLPNSHTGLFNSILGLRNFASVLDTNRFNLEHIGPVSAKGYTGSSARPKGKKGKISKSQEVQDDAAKYK
ncbi:hypothetical protein PAAG_11410 [Paracoccidioides lutzii Pb01]|uniref:Uncharacterized protein n=1 Tax=Paracoccidioides lutzii (strain ATCC MYA-826 / Pb01) TaxID=502779 RepID=A0A0A2V6U5_PARBA|nr:hypothetical protein PAAG_11410 [Paracoccidioides lutzii Pb01]KGQ01835.1 hypothetical protein PAAG_11410 [Paracoccidioides lutzii Pb01]